MCLAREYYALSSKTGLHCSNFKTSILRQAHIVTYTCAPALINHSTRRPDQMELYIVVSRNKQKNVLIFIVVRYYQYNYLENKTYELMNKLNGTEL